MLRSLLVLASLGACATGSDPRVTDTTPPPPSSVVADTMRIVAEFQQSGWDAPATLVIEDSATFAAAWATAHAGMTPVPSMPQVNFDRDRVIVVAAGMRPSGGYTIHAASPSLGAIDVVVQRPGPGCAATAQITQPAIVLAVPRAPQPPRVVVNERAGPPC